jgi:hypothetical protein
MLADNYRKKLGEHLGQKIVLECSDFRIDRDDDLGRCCMLLLKPRVIRIDGRSPDENWTIDHLWVNVPSGASNLAAKCAELASKMRITGVIHEYQYAITGQAQAGVRADNIEVLKIRKDIARRYNLSPDYTPTKEAIKRIISQEEIRNSIAADSSEKKPLPGLDKYEIQKIIRSSDKRHVDIMAGNLMERIQNLDYDEARKSIIAEMSNLDEYYVFVKIKSGECLGYGYIRPVDRKTVEAGYEMLIKHQKQEIEKVCAALFFEYVRSQYKTTTINYCAADTADMYETDDEKIDRVTKAVLERHINAFKELAK